MEMEWPDMQDKMCKASPCWNETCDDEQHTLDPYPITVYKWDSVGKNYTAVGQIASHVLAPTFPSPGGFGDGFGIFTHGPLMRPQDIKEPGTLPPVYFSASFKNKVYRVDGIKAGQPANQPWTGNLSVMGDGVAPSTTWPITTEPNGQGALKGFLVAEGNPFWINRNVNGSGHETLKGGVTYMSASDDSNCTTIFPTNTFNPMKMLLGQVVNTVQCHEQSGVCFFSVWKFYDDSFPEMMAPDCLYWCTVDDMTNPQKCIAGDVVKDDKGNKICHSKEAPYHRGGAVHGFTVGNTDPNDPDSFDLLLLFTGGAGFDQGVSSMHKLKVKTLLDDVQVQSMVPFATDLWNVTVKEPHDIGLDHAWVDDTKKLIWVSAFRETNPGIHMVDYETGELKYSLRGFDSYFPGQFTYPAGVSGTGTLGQEGSLLALATSTQKGLTVPPLLQWGRSGVFIIDISHLNNLTTY